MSPKELTYLVFGIVLLAAVILDLGVFSKSSRIISVKQALVQTIFWVVLSLLFGVFIWFEDGHNMAITYLSAYFTEWSLSIDNIFVFILIFNYFKIDGHYEGRALFIGILIAILFRIIFITIGVAIVVKFHWVLYLFGIFLLYTGIKMFVVREEDNFQPDKKPMYKFMRKHLRIAEGFSGGRYFIRRNKKLFLTKLTVVVLVLGVTDLAFSLDSIPAVLSITQVPLLVYTSNIFAVLGLRSLYFLLKGAATQFSYLRHGIAVILIFIGIKMLLEIFHIDFPVVLSLVIILICFLGSILLSVYKNKREAKLHTEDK